MQHTHAPVPGYPTYFATRDGAIFRQNPHKGLIELRPAITKLGYLQLVVMVDGDWRRQKGMLVHRIIALTYMRPPIQGEEINHIDGDKTNNKVCNLQWCTRSENVKHAYDKLSAMKSRPRGIAQWQAKLSDDMVREVRHLNSLGVTNKEIALILGNNITVSIVSHVINGHTYKHVK